MMAYAFRAAALMTLTIAAAVAEPPHAHSSRRQASTRPRTEHRSVDPFEAVRALRLELPEAAMRDLPFDEFTEWLARQSGINVVPRWEALERAGLDRDAPVSLRLKNATLGDVLRGVLTQLEPGRAPLSFRAHSNIITISTKADLDRVLVLRTYDVEDLLVLVPSFEQTAGGAPLLHATPQIAEKHALKNADTHVQTLIDAIMDSVYPDSWKARGGSGTITYYRGRLIVRNTPEVHAVLSGQLRVTRTDP